MRIEGWSVDAFGHLTGTEMTGLQPGLNVVVGPNEAGKTTLLHFLRWVLFGFPHHANTTYKQYKPESGSFGGRVRLVSDDRLIVVERHAGSDHPVLMNENGSPVTDLTWGGIVGTASLELFESVFAITVDELNNFGQLNNDDVREHIYAASVVGAGQSVQAVLTQLDDTRRADLGPRSGEIRALSKQLKLAVDELKEAQRQAADLPAQRDNAESLLAVVESERGELKNIETQATRIGKLLELWPTWSEAIAAREELDKGPPEVELLHPIDKLDGALQKLNAANDAAETTKDALASVTRSIAAIDVDDALLAVAADVSLLDRGLGADAGLRSQLTQQESELERNRALLVDRLQDLGADWDSDRLSALDTSVGVVGELQAHDEELSAAQRAEQSADLAVQAARGTAEQRSGELNDRRFELEMISAQLGAVTDRPAAHSAATELRRLLPQLEAERQMGGGNESLALALEQLNRQSTSPLAAWITPAVFGVALVAAVGAVVGFVTDDPILGGLLAVVASALAVLGTVTLRSRRDTSEPLPAHSSQQPASDLAKTSAPLSERVAAAGAVAGLGPHPTVQAIDALLDNLRSEARMAEDVEGLNRKSGLADEAVNEAATKHQDSIAATAALLSKWEQWLLGHGLPPNLTPDDAVKFTDRAKSARESAGAVGRLERHVKTLLESVDEYLQTLTDVLLRSGVEGTDEPYGELVKLAQRVKQEQKAQDDRATLEAQLPDQEAAVAGAEEAAGKAADALAKLFKIAGVEDEDGFRSMASAQNRRELLNDTVRDADIQFKGAFGEGVAADSARLQLGTGDVETWEGDQIRLATAGEEADSAYEEAVRVSHDADNALEQLQNSADVPELSQQVEALRSAIEEAMERWAVATLAHRAIADTLGEFERERQPAVVKRAAECFDRITDGRYSGLLPRHDSLEVVLSSGARLNAGRLSRGTTEQLYLAMRFGLALDYAERTPLPLILDDVLVNADHQRRHRLAEELARVSQEIQVLIFTCHPETAELLSDGRPTTTVKQLGQ